MIKISAEEAKYLRDHGRGGDVHMSSRTKKSGGKKYYSTESFKAMKLISEYRKSRLIESVER